MFRRPGASLATEVSGQPGAHAPQTSRKNYIGDHATETTVHLQYSDKHPVVLLLSTIKVNNAIKSVKEKVSNKSWAYKPQYVLIIIVN